MNTNAPASLPLNSAPATREPITVSGVYEFVDGTVAEVAWIEGQPRYIRRVAATHRWTLA